MNAATLPVKTSCFEYLSKFVRQKSAIVLEPSKSYLMESRLGPIARENDLDSLEELVELLQRPDRPDIAQRVIDAMTTNESSFFRDIHPFEALRKDVIPSLIEKRSRERTLNIWSNACSSGQEIYSIAILLRENFPMLGGWKIRLVASDLSTAILARARAGSFNQTEINRGLPMPMILKYFTKSGMFWQIKEDVRRSIEFCEVNLIERWPVSLTSMDIIFLRNVLIYFSTDTKTSVLKKIHSTMNSDGYLFLGGAETTMNLNVPFERDTFGKATCYRPT
jgi:chemotaxis protein methyltransferase CheR